MEGSADTYPARTFIKFTARNQLIADLTGQEVTAFVSRLGGQSYVQTAHPSDGFGLNESTDKTLPIDLGSMTMNFNPRNADLSHQPELPEAEFLQQLPESTDLPDDSALLDEALFAEIAKTTFHPDRHPELYRSCGTSAASKEVEKQVAQEIVATYKRVKLQQQSPIVQKLNALLSNGDLE